MTKEKGRNFKSQKGLLFVYGGNSTKISGKEKESCAKSWRIIPIFVAE